MRDDARPETTYTIGHGGEAHTLMSRRTAETEAGFTRTEGFADATVAGEPTALHRHAAFTREHLASAELRQVTVGIGITADELDHLADDLDAWSERPDAMVVVLWSAGLGWVD
jgi:hypothetical protein